MQDWKRRLFAAKGNSRRPHAKEAANVGKNRIQTKLLLHFGLADGHNAFLAALDHHHAGQVNLRLRFQVRGGRSLFAQGNSHERRGRRPA